MTESAKTAICFAGALGAVGLALLTRPSTNEYDIDQLRGTQLVEEFESSAPKRLRIESRDEETGEQQAFEVAQVDGVWSIPSKSGYPADATEQMASAVEGVVGREILAAEPGSSGNHAEYGVLDPADATADSDTGFGKRVTLSDAENQPLADLIIGDEIKDSPGQYFVRRAKQDPVYRVEIDLEKFSTDFSDWIEKDLLGLTTFDVSGVKINDYTVELNIGIEGGRLVRQLFEDRRAKLDLSYNDDESKWVADALETYDKDKRAYEPFELAGDEELNEDALREMKNALDDLVIVDVERKPEGLSGDLRAGEEFIDPRDPDLQDTVVSLSRRGFIAVPDEQGRPEILSSEGEVVITLNTGVEYVLRFGDLQIDPSAEASTPTDEMETDDADESGSDEGLNRYLFVMARFNDAAVEPPAIQELPELPAEDDAAQSSEEEAAEDDGAETEGSNEESESDDAEEANAEGADSESADGDDDTASETAEEEATADDLAKQREAIEAERKRIEESNARLQSEYEEKLEEGRKRVEELNDRFGDWYYVIPNDVFKKIHLGRDQVIKKKEQPEGEADSDSENATPAAPFGVPGGAVPGLPDLGIDTDEAEDSETGDAESDNGQPNTEETAGGEAEESVEESADESSESSTDN